MIKEKINLIIALSFVLGLVTFTSCDDDDPQPEQLEAYTDAYAEKIVVNDEEKTAMAFFVQANKELKSVTVKAPGDNGKTYTLTVDKNSKKVFRFKPTTEDFSTEDLVTGNYEFTIESTSTDDEKLKQNDELKDAELEKIAIKTTEYSEDKLKTTWDAVSNSDSYVLILSDTDGNIIYNAEVAEDKTEFSFGTSTNGWIGDNKAETGKTYKLELLALLFEEGSTSTNQAYNVQYVSLDSKDVVWGE